MPDALAAAAAALRWVTFAAIALVTGSVAFRWFVLPRAVAGTANWPDATRAAAVRRAARLGLVGASALVPAALGRLGLQVAEMREPGESWRALAAVMLGGTTWGVGWVLQVGSAIVTCVALALVARRSAQGGPPTGAWAVAAFGALALCASPALSGHAAGSPRLAVAAIGADALHVAGAGSWLGTLLVLLVAGLPAARLVRDGDSRRELAMIRAFSTLALFSAALVVASGVFASWLHLDRPSSLWLTSYGRLLLLKVVLVAFVAVVGAYNWRRVTPRFDSPGGVAALRRSAIVELALGAVVVAATAALVATPLPGEE